MALSSAHIYRLGAFHHPWEHQMSAARSRHCADQKVRAIPCVIVRGLVDRVTIWTPLPNNILSLPPFLATTFNIIMSKIAKIPLFPTIFFLLHPPSPNKIMNLSPPDNKNGTSHRVVLCGVFLAATLLYMWYMPSSSGVCLSHPFRDFPVGARRCLRSMLLLSRKACRMTLFRCQKVKGHRF